MSRFLFLILSFFLVSCGERSAHYIVREQPPLDTKLQKPIVRQPLSRPPLKKNLPPISKTPPSALPKPITKSDPKPVSKPVSNSASKPGSKSGSKPAAKPVQIAKKIAQPAKNKKAPIIVLDPGHGGKDTGALSKKNAYEEKKLTLNTVNMIKNYLAQMGYEVILTRSKDAFVSLEDRAEIANKTKAFIFVSVHYNYCPNESAEGIEIFYYKDDKNPFTKRLIESRKLGETILSDIVKHACATSRGVKKANFAVIRETKMPAILIEGGFLSNPTERKKILDAHYQKYLAYGIASGIDHYIASIK
jgi:N-acetylmuramoyl-L-alanine amidase